MNSTNSRIQRLKTMISLEEKRIALQGQLDSIQEQMTGLQNQILSEETKPVSPIAIKKPSQPSGTTQRAGRGELTEQVVAALQAAGKTGIRVKELAKSLGTKPLNIHSWFHSNLKRYPSITKLAGGHYRLDGSLELAPAATRAKGKSAGKRPAGRTKRGELSANILSELKNAGARGISVREIAEALGKNYKNIYIWFSTTAKNYPNIVKLDKSQYRLES